MPRGRRCQGGEGARGFAKVAKGGEGARGFDEQFVAYVEARKQHALGIFEEEIQEEDEEEERRAEERKEYFRRMEELRRTR